MSKELLNQPFFIVGCQRSGTTLLRLMVNAHPRLRVPRESWFISDLMDQLPLDSPLTEQERELAFRLISNHHRWKEWEIADEKLREIIDSLESPLLRDLVDAVFQNCANPENKPRWGDKTPPYLKEMDRLHQLFDKAKFIHIIRDGRDVCVSLLKTKWNDRTTIEQIAQYWCEMVEAGIASGGRLGKELYLEVNYEDIVLQPEESLKRICDFLGEEFDGRMLDFYQSSSEELSEAQKQKQIHEKTKRPPKSSDAYRWRREMNPMAVALFEAIAAETMDRVGQNRRYQGALRLIPWGYKLVIESRNLRKRLGLQIPYGILRKLGVAGDTVYQETENK